MVPSYPWYLLAEDLELMPTGAAHEGREASPVRLPATFSTYTARSQDLRAGIRPHDIVTSVMDDWCE